MVAREGSDSIVTAGEGTGELDEGEVVLRHVHL